MSMVPMGGIVGSAAGVPLSQAAGSETERAQKDGLAVSRRTDAEWVAERAAGIGETGKDQESSERDADGRRLWESPPKSGDEEAEPGAGPLRQSKDATGQCGNQLDLTG